MSCYISSLFIPLLECPPPSVLVHLSPSTLPPNSQRATFVLTVWQPPHHPQWSISLPLAPCYCPLQPLPTSILTSLSLYICIASNPKAPPSPPSPLPHPLPPQLLSLKTEQMQPGRTASMFPCSLTPALWLQRPSYTFPFLFSSAPQSITCLSFLATLIAHLSFSRISLAFQFPPFLPSSFPSVFLPCTGDLFFPCSFNLPPGFLLGRCIRPLPSFPNITQGYSCLSSLLLHFRLPLCFHQ